MISDFLISTKTLHSIISDENVVVLDASLKPIIRYDDLTVSDIIPGAVKFDIKNVFSDKNSKYDHTLPDAKLFVDEMRRLGINNNSKIIVYDNQGIYSSPRVWFMIKSFGHNNVFILDGGLPEWIKNGFKTESCFVKNYGDGDFSLRTVKKYFCDAQYVLDSYLDKNFCIVDARSEGRFAGIEAEPRDNLKSGHIPYSFNLPFNKVLNEGRFLSKNELERIFSNISNNDKELIFSCGSGITSCITAMAAIIAGYSKVKIFDGSWSEWGAVENDYPVATL